MLRTVRHALYGDEDIYAGFPLDDHPLDLHTWGGDNPIFGRLIAALRPERIVEVGTWKGASAITMARACRQHGVPCEEIVCIDSWLGSAGMLIRGSGEQTHPSALAVHLRRRHGYPRLYDDFLANVIHTGCQDLITPLAASTDVAAAVLATIGLPVDLIYLDANHSHASVTADLAAYWPLLNPGGVLLAHDYVPGHPGCLRAIDEFAERHGLTRYVEGSWCLMVKDLPAEPASPQPRLPS